VTGTRNDKGSRISVLGSRHGRHGRGGGARGLVWIALAAAAAGLVFAVIVIEITGWGGRGGRVAAPPGAVRPAEPARVVGAGAPRGWPSWGFTQTQYAPDLGGSFPQAVTATSRQAVPQDLPIMGWGLDNPEPAPGRFSFGTLDQRIQFVRQTHGIPVITLAGAPDWMKGGRDGQTDWSKLDVAPTPDHYQDFARLAAQVAQRYPDVRYFVVWNEFKGMWSSGKNRWDYEGYTTLYNDVYTALKAVNPDIQVGGPYMVMNSDEPGYGPPTAVSGPWGSVAQTSLDAVDYWLAHKKGADFLVVDGAAMPDQADPSLGEFAELAKFSAVTAWLRGQSGGRLPVWWAEWYVEPNGADWSDQHLGAVQAAALMALVKGGAATAMYWSPQTSTTGSCAGCLWDGSADGGQGTPTLRMLQNFAEYFPPGARLETVSSSNPTVQVLGDKQQLLVVNTSASPATAVVNGNTLSLAGYEVRWVSW
jgi:hypothetical protein